MFETIDNNETIFFYKSPIGILRIQYNIREKKWFLIINEIFYGPYLSPIAAADDVYTQTTGDDEWDSLETDAFIEDIPTDIYCWEKINKNT